MGKPGKPKPKKLTRAKPKTAEELDAEMTDYFAGNGTATETTAATATEPAATGEDLGMEEISVSDYDHELIT